jgi:GNAT superfamily N-acetyltransferase
VVQVTLESRVYSSPLPLRAVAEGDELPLVSAYEAAFADTVEYCDVPPEAIARSAGENIRAFLSGDRGPALPSSCVATCSGTAGLGVGAVVGAALLTRARNGAPLLDMLFVRPAWQRRGLATALVSWSLQELLARGERVLRSRYHLANEASRLWHRRLGFAPEQDLGLHDVGSGGQVG